MSSNLKLDFGLSLWRDLLTLDVGVLQVDGERVRPRTHHPGNPFPHDNLNRLFIYFIFFLETKLYVKFD
jgi:hypothetical protein